jgi:hypothetical protein
LRPDSSGDVGEGGMVVGRDERNMKVRKETLPRWIARHLRKRRDRRQWLFVWGYRGGASLEIGSVSVATSAAGVLKAERSWEG